MKIIYPKFVIIMLVIWSQIFIYFWSSNRTYQGAHWVQIVILFKYNKHKTESWNEKVSYFIFYYEYDNLI